MFSNDMIGRPDVATVLIVTLANDFDRCEVHVRVYLLRDLHEALYNLDQSVHSCTDVLAWTSATDEGFL